MESFRGKLTGTDQSLSYFIMMDLTYKFPPFCLSGALE
jgi:hypothetical protein